MKNKRKKLDTKQKQKFIRYIITYMIKMSIVIYLLIAVIYEANPATAFNTEKVTGRVQDIQVDTNGKYTDTLTFTINNKKYTLAWLSPERYGKLIEPMKSEDQITLTLKTERNFASLKKEYAKRVVDVRSDTTVYHDIKHSNRSRIIGLIAGIILFVFFTIVFTVWFIFNIRYLL